MRSIRTLPVVCFCFLLVLSTSAQQTTTQATQASVFLQSALAALVGTNSITDVTLTGSARRIAGSDDESGTATLKAVSGASRFDFSFPSGPRNEVLNSSGDTPTGTWSGPDGVSHDIAFHNLLTEPAWFFPSFAIARGLSSGYIVTCIGQESHNFVAVQHLTISQAFSSVPGADSATFQHLSQTDLYLDATTLLPVALAFNTHPDDNELLDIPIEVRFSDYRSVSGAQVPFHVQKFLNNGLILDLQFQNAALNTGLTAAAF
jgi:hypothetical protein